MDHFQNHDTEAICTGVGWVWLVRLGKDGDTQQKEQVSFVAEALPKSERIGNETVDPRGAVASRW